MKLVANAFVVAALHSPHTHAISRSMVNALTTKLNSLLHVSVLSTGDAARSALPECTAGPDHASVAGQATAAGRDGRPARPERGAGEEVSGLQEGAGRHPASPGGDQVGGEEGGAETQRGGEEGGAETK